MTLNPRDPQPGIYHDVPEDVYRKCPGICQSDLKEMITPAHYRAVIDASRQPPSDAQIIGTLTHALVLCQRRDFVAIPEDAPKKPTKAQLEAKKPSDDTIAAINWWNMFIAANPGKQLLKKDEADQIENIAASVRAHPDASAILKSQGNNEVACFKIHERTGLLLRGRADRVCTDSNNYTVIPDLKTCQSGGASYDEFRKDIFKWGYHRQADFYLSLFDASFFVFIAVEKDPPYAVAVYDLESRDIELGRRENERDLSTIAECTKSGVWPAYPTGIRRISMPEWAFK